MKALDPMAHFQDADSQFRILAETLPELVWTTDPDGYHDYFNRRWYDFSGLKPHQALGEGWRSVLHPADAERTLEAWHAALRTGKPYEIEFRLKSVDGRYHWFLGRALPVRDSSGRILRWFGTCTDIEAQKRAEEALSRLDEQHRLALEAAELGTWDYGLASGIVSWDERTCALFGVSSSALRSLPHEETLARIHPDDQPRVRELIAAALDPRSDGRYEAEYRITRQDGSVHWINARGQAYFVGEGADRRAVRLSGVFSDVTPRRRAEEAQELLTRELNHRVKNLFAIASGLVSMTARTSKTPKDMAEALRGRLGALARAHELVRPAPAGDELGPSLALDKLVLSILEPYVHLSGRDHIVLNGPDVAIGGTTVTSLALVLHELATNAAKYGCLARSEGRLSIEWRRDGESVSLTWTERNGPPISKTPDFEGFGSLLARKTITGQLGGTLQYDWQPQGLHVRMTIPVERLAH
jgi:PAS domain S-box-containing protein